MYILFKGFYTLSNKTLKYLSAFSQIQKRLTNKLDPAFAKEIFYPALLGGIGGLTRGIVGLLKALSLRRRILWNYYFITVTVAAIIGVFVGIIFNFDYRLSLLAGYAGTDILEGIYKSFKVQKVYVASKKGK